MVSTLNKILESHFLLYWNIISIVLFYEYNILSVSIINVYIGMCMSDYSQVLDWWSHLLDSLIQRVTTLYNLVLDTYTSVHSYVFTAVAW
jgi:hypothetical protein